MSTKRHKQSTSGTAVLEPKKKIRQTVSKDDLIEAVLDHLETYHNTAEVILQDYVADPGMCSELAAADDTFREAIENIELKKEDFNYLHDKLQSLAAEDVDLDKLLELVNDIDEDAVKEFMAKKQKGAVIISIPVQTQDQQEKLEHFVKTEIYPNYNDQRTILDF